MMDLAPNIEALRTQEQNLIRQLAAVRTAIRALQSGHRSSITVVAALEDIVRKNPGLFRRDLLEKLKASGISTSLAYLKVLLIRRSDLFRREDGKVYLTKK